MLRESLNCGRTVLFLAVFAIGSSVPYAYASDNPALGISEPTTDPCGQDQCCGDPNCCENPPCCPQPPCDCKGTGSPLNAKFGSMKLPFTDLAYKIGDIDFAIERTYTSDDAYIGSFGRGMTSTLDQMSISTFNGAANHELVVVRSARGQRYEYLRQPDLSYSPPLGHYDVLEKVGNEFRLTNEDGDVMTFDADTGLLESRVDKNGHAWSFSYNGNGQPTDIELFPGQSISISYGPNGLVDSISDFGGRTVFYDYDTNGDLSVFTDAENHAWTYTYGPEGKIAEVINPLGQIEVSVTYDGMGRVQTMADTDGDFTYTYSANSTTKRNNSLSTLLGTDINQILYYDSEGVITRIREADGTDTLFGYDALFSLTSSTESDGYTTTYEYDSLGRVTRETYPDANFKTYTYDPTLDLKTSETNERNVTTLWEYDTAGNLTRQVEAAGTPREQVMTWEYDATGHVTREVDAAGLLTTASYDSFGQMTQQVVPGPVTLTFEYDALGNLTRSADHTGNEVLYEYDALLRATKVTDAAGNVSTRTYDAAGRLAAQDDALIGQHGMAYDALGQVTANTDGRGATVQSQYVGVYLTQESDALGRDALYEYDVNGFVTKVTRTSALGDRVTTIEPDDVGRETSKTGISGITETRTYDNRRRLASISRSDGLTATYLYDGVGNLTQTTDFWGNTLVRTYDELDRVVTEGDDFGQRFQYFYDSGGRVTQKALPRGTQTYEYDAAGYNTRFVDADGFATTFQYDVLGRRTAIARQGGETTTFEPDGAQRLTKVTRPSLRETDWTYAGYWYPQTTTEAGGRTTTFEYDGTFSVTRMVLPNGDTYGFAYDGAGRLTGRTLPSNDTIVAEYDDFDRRTKISYPDLTETTIAYNNFDQISSVTNTTGGTISYGYDAVGRVTSETYNGRTVMYQYSPDYKSVTTTYPSGLAVTRQLDSMLRTESVTIAGDASPSVTYTYAADGVPETAEFGSGMDATYTFSGEGFIQGISYVNTNGGALVRGWARGTNDLGSTDYIARLDDPAQSSQILRDVEDRVTGKLVGALDGSNTVPAPTRTESWTLDGLGNWSAYTLDGASESRTHDLNNRISTRTTGAPVTFAYDANGNLTDDGTYLYSWNYDGLLTEVRLKSTNDLVEHYDYSPVNRLARVTTGAGDVIEYVRDLEDQVIEVYVNGGLLASNVYGGQFDEHVCSNINGVRYYYITDLGQNVAALTDDAGDVVESYEYDSYGAPRFYDGAGTPLSASAIGNDFLFSGRLYRSAPNLYYYRARYFSPELGRFLTPDPMGYNTAYAENLYEYGESSPIDIGDPYGLCTGCVSTKLGGTSTAFKKKLGGPIPWSVSVDTTASGQVKVCRKCCKNGVCGASVKGTLEIGGSGSATFDITPPIGGLVWALFKAVWEKAGGQIGLYVVVTGSHATSKSWSSDTCTGETSSKFCAQVGISATAKGGVKTPSVGGCGSDLWAYGGASYTYKCCSTNGQAGKCSHCVSGKVGVKGSIKCKLMDGWFGNVSLSDSFDIVIWEKKSSGCS